MECKEVYVISMFYKITKPALHPICFTPPFVLLEDYIICKNLISLSIGGNNNSNNNNNNNNNKKIPPPLVN